MTDPIEAAEQRRQQIAVALERLEAAANAWRKQFRRISRDATYFEAMRKLIHAIDDLARRRGGG